MRQPKIFYAFALIVTVVVGLGSRAYAGFGANFIHLYVGDVLYATMYYWIIRGLAPSKSRYLAAGLALIICFVIEIMQWYHVPWIDAVRATRLGGLILGFGFLWSDLVCYALGVFLGWILDSRINRPFINE